jgi:hypothetical protein
MASGLPLIDRGISELFRLLQSSPFDVQRQMGHTMLTMTNHYASLNVRQLQQSHDLYSPLRAKETGSERESSGSGYWDIEKGFHLTATDFAGNLFVQVL